MKKLHGVTQDVWLAANDATLTKSFSPTNKQCKFKNLKQTTETIYK